MNCFFLVHQIVWKHWHNWKKHFGGKDEIWIRTNFDAGTRAGFEAQRRDLAAAGAERTFGEQVSSVARRAQLERLLGELRKGDVVVVTKLDRLARSMRDLLSIVDRIETAGASLQILGMNLDTGTPTGRLMLTVFGGVAEFERAMMLERQREGIAKAKTEGKYKGRAPRLKPRPMRSRCAPALALGTTFKV